MHTMYFQDVFTCSGYESANTVSADTWKKVQSGVDQGAYNQMAGSDFYLWQWYFVCDTADGVKAVCASDKMEQTRDNIPPRTMP